MPFALLKIVFVAGLALYLFGIYGPSVRRYRRQKIAEEFTRPLDAALDLITFAAWQILPLIYIFTDWVAFADYRLPDWAGLAGAAIFAGSLLLLRSAYTALGENWSPKIDVREGQTLITEGAFKHVRHPIYAGIWLWALAQPLIIQNWIAGPALGAAFLPLYLTRVPREERMMHEAFGERYARYASRTGRLFPRLRAGE